MTKKTAVSENKMSQWELVEVALKLGVHTLIQGLPGLGKSSAIRVLCKRLSIPCYEVTLTRRTSVIDLYGHYMPNANGGWEFNKGPIIRAAECGEQCILLINEIDHADSSVVNALRPIMDETPVLEIGPQTIPITGKITVIGTLNGKFDALDSALQDRFAAKLSVTTPADHIVNRLNDEQKGLGDWLRENVEHGNAVSSRWTMAVSRAIKAGTQPEVLSALFGSEVKTIAAFLEVH